MQSDPKRSHTEVPIDDLTSACSQPSREPFGAHFLTTFASETKGYDPAGVRSSWTTNEDSAG